VNLGSAWGYGPHANHISYLCTVGHGPRMGQGGELSGLTGQQNAAIMMLVIGEDRAGTLFGSLVEEELKELSQAMVNLGTVNAKTIEALFVEFA